ncbi:MAG: T9SS type A sorting domain-containing protein [Bacteroidota bacterium]
MFRKGALLLLVFFIFSTSQASPKEIVQSAPVLASISDLTIGEGNNASLTVTATDPNGDSINYQMDNLPVFASFQDLGDGSAVLSFNPDFTNAGTYPITVRAIDSFGNEDAQTFILTVEDREPLSGRQILTDFQHTVNSGGRMDYYIYYPQDYDQFPNNREVLIALHGNAERGGNPNRLIGADGEGSIVKMINEGAHLPIMVVSPHGVPNVGGVNTPNWDIAQLKQLVQHLLDDFNVNPDKIYMTGFSAGGQGVWQYITTHPYDIAATVNIAGLSNLTNQVYNINLQQAPFPCLIKDIPHRVWHSNNDGVVDKSQSVNMVNAINVCTPEPDPLAELNLIPGSEHDLRALVYSDINSSGNIYDWFLAQDRSLNALDMRAPSYINNTPQILNQTSTSFDTRVNINEEGAIYIGLYSDGANPSSDDVAAGIGAIASFSHVGTNQTFSFSGLQPSTNYDLFVVAEDDEPTPNRQSTPTLVSVTTLDQDTNEPIFITAPFAKKINGGSFDIEFQINEPGTIYWALYVAGDTPAGTIELTDGTGGISNGNLTTNGSLETLVVDGLVTGTDYDLYVIAADDEMPNANLQTSASVVSVQTLDTSLGNIPESVVQMNFIRPNNSTNLTDWNDIQIGSLPKGTTTFNGLSNTEGGQSLMTLKVQHRINGSNFSGTADNSNRLRNGVYPDRVLRYATYTASLARMSLSNLNPEKRYSITIHGGRAASGSRIGRYTIGGTTQELECVDNTDNVLVWELLTPNSANEIPIRFEKFSSSWAYVNGMVVEEFTFSNADSIAPSAPSGFAGNVVNGETTVDLSWNDNSESDIFGYNLYRSTVDGFAPGGSNLLAAGITSNSFQNIDLVDGETYYYLLTAIDSSGNESPSATQLSFLIQSDVDAPDAPTGLIASALSSSEIALDWDDSAAPDFASYSVYRSDSSIFAPNASYLIASGLTNSAYSDPGLTASTTYYYTVTASDLSGNESSLSTEVSAQTDADTIPPAAPQGVSASLTNPSTALVDWDDNTESDFASYNLYRSTSAGFVPSPATLVAANLTISALTNTGLSSETTFYYVITAVDIYDNESALSIEAAITTPDITPPASPAGLIATANGSNQIDLDWQDNTESDFSTYEIHRSESGGFTPSTATLLAAGLTSSDYTDLGLVPSTTYFYLVIAYDSIGNTSDPSSIASAQTEADMTPPASPSGLVGTAQSSSAIALDWDDNTEEDLTSYNVYRSLSPNVQLDTSSMVGFNLNASQFTDNGLMPSTTYYYVVTAEDLAGNESTPSTEISVLTDADIVPPAAPTGLQVTNVEVGAITLDWNDNGESDFASYNIYRGTSSGFAANTTSLLDSGLTSSTYIDNAVSTESTYFYVVQAVDQFDNVSSASNEVSATTPDITPPAAPTGLIADAAVDTEVQLGWDDNAEADFTSYNLYRGSLSGFPTDATSLIASGLTSSNFVDNTVSANNTYFYKVTALDDTGNESSSSAEASVTTPESLGPVLVETLQLNFVNSNSAPTVSGWHNINLKGLPKGEISFNGIQNADGANSSIVFKARNRINGSTISNVADNGSGLNGGIFPNPVARFSAFTSGLAKVILSNLDGNRAYTLTMYGARAASGSRVTEYLIESSGLISQTLESIDNTSNTVVFENLVPDSNNEIIILFRGVGTWGYLNALLVDVYDHGGNTVNNNNTRNVAFDLPYENASSDAFEVYPNPSSGRISLVMENESPARFEILNLQGGVVHQGEMDGSEQEIDLTGVNQGIYMVKVTEGEQVYMKRLFIK